MPKKLKSSEVYEVYICRYDDEIVYIGQGRFNRHKHCCSGGSHVVGLNELYLLGDKNLFDMEVKYLQSKKEAEDLEMRLIKKHRPKFNSVGLNNNRGERAILRKNFISSFTRYVDGQRVFRNVRNKTFEEFHDMLKYHTLGRIEDEEGFIFLAPISYKTRGRCSWSRCIRRMQGREFSSEFDRCFLTALHKAYFEVYQKEPNLIMLIGGGRSEIDLSAFVYKD